MLLVLVAGTALGVLGWRAVFAGGGPGEGATGTARGAELDACDGQPTREVCRSITVDGRQWRYAFYPADQETAETVIFDPGGPGVAVLSGQYQLGMVRDHLLGGEYNVLALEEPWVTAPVPDSCATALTAFYLALRQGAEYLDPARVLTRECDLAGDSFGFTASGYRAAVAAILERHRLTLAGFLAHSFGSVRLAYLSGSELAPRWAIITRPYPVGVDPGELTAARVEVLRRHVGEPSVDPAVAVEVADRSLPVTAFDVVSAVIGTGYVTDEELADVVDHLTTASDPALIGRLSDQLWMRYGVDSLSPGMLAYWSEVCRATGAGQVPPTLDLTDPATVMAAAFAPCTGRPERLSVDTRATEVCVTASVNDSVTPGALIERYLVGATVVAVSPRSHGDLSGLDRCWEDVTAHE
mgnify:FL=1